MTKISVIIPVFKVEAYLRKCLDSLIGQTFRDWEAICVDDGSPDLCGEILDRYAASDKRFKVIHKRNEGVSVARNKALELADGEWIMFLDSDDFLHPQTMEICLDQAMKYGGDLVAYTYDRLYRTTRIMAQTLHIPVSDPVKFKKYKLHSIKAVQTADIFDYASEYSRPKNIRRRWAVKHCQPWRCMYKASRIKDIKFEPGVMYEDFPWWSEVMLNISGAVILNLPLYFYRPNFTGYIHSSGKMFKTQSLEKCIKAAEHTYSIKASPAQKAKWEANFLTHLL